MDIVNSDLNSNSKHQDKCKFKLKLIPMATISNVYSLANFVYYGKNSIVLN